MLNISRNVHNVFTDIDFCAVPIQALKVGTYLLTYIGNSVFFMPVNNMKEFLKSVHNKALHIFTSVFPKFYPMPHCIVTRTLTSKLCM